AIAALRARGTRGLTVIANTPGFGPLSPQVLFENGQVRKLVASFGGFPYRMTPAEEMIGRGDVELELVPQGTLVERVRCGGAGIAAFYTPTGVGTEIARGKEAREIDGRSYLLERAIRADWALVRGWPPIRRETSSSTAAAVTSIRSGRWARNRRS